MKETTFRVLKSELASWYVFLFLVTSGFTSLLVWKIDDWRQLPVIAYIVLSFVALCFLMLWVGPLPLTRARVTIGDAGIAHIASFFFGGRKYRWTVQWDEIDDWSFVETYVRGGYVWLPHVFISAHGHIYETYHWIIGAKRAAMMAAELTSHCGPPKDVNNPVLPVISGQKPMWRHPGTRSKKPFWRL